MLLALVVLAALTEGRKWKESLRRRGHATRDAAEALLHDGVQAELTKTNANAKPITQPLSSLSERTPLTLDVRFHRLHDPTYNLLDARLSDAQITQLLSLIHIYAADD